MQKSKEVPGKMSKTNGRIAHFGHSSLREVLEQAGLADGRVADEDESVLK